VLARAAGRRCRRTVLYDPLEGLADSGIDRRQSEERLHPQHDHVDVQGSSSIAQAMRPLLCAAISVVPAPPLGSSTTLSAGSHVQDRVDNQLHWLDDRVAGQVLVAHLAGGLDPGIAPDVCPATATLAEPHIVRVRARLLEHGHQLVLQAVQAAHAAVGLGPDTQVQKLETGRLALNDEIGGTAPVHAHKGDATDGQPFNRSVAHFAEKDGELGPRHLARGHGEPAVLHPVQPADVTGDRNVTGRIGEDALAMTASQNALDVAPSVVRQAPHLHLHRGRRRRPPPTSS